MFQNGIRKNINLLYINTDSLTTLAKTYEFYKNFANYDKKRNLNIELG